MDVSIRRFEGTNGEEKRLPKDGGGLTPYLVQSDESEFSELWLSEILAVRAAAALSACRLRENQQRSSACGQHCFIANPRCLTGIILSYRIPSDLLTKDPKCLILRKLPPRKAGTLIHRPVPEINTSGKSVPWAGRSAKRGDICYQ